MQTSIMLICIMLATLGDWLPAARWWKGNLPEWDLVSTSRDGRSVLLGEAKAWKRRATVDALRPEVRRIRARAIPRWSSMHPAPELHWALFVPEVAPRVPRMIDGVRIVTLEELLGK